MHVEVTREGTRESPASAMYEHLMQPIGVFMMLMGGIESISVTRYEAGMGSYLHASISNFAGAPKEITDQGVIIKDAIAQIMGVANITRILAKPSKKEAADFKASWEGAVEMARRPRASGSGQDFTAKAEQAEPEEQAEQAEPAQDTEGPAEEA